MSLQDTVVELFQAQRIDKATAYRLLAESRKGEAGGPGPGQAAMSEVRLSVGANAAAGADHPADHPAADPAGDLLIAFLCVLAHLHGEGELSVDLLDTQGCCPLQTGLDDAWTASTLKAEIARRRLARPASQGAADLAWIEGELTDTQPRKLLAQCTRSADGALTLRLAAAQGAPGKLPLDEWPGLLAHLAAQIAADADRPLRLLDRLPPNHRRMLADYNATHAYLPPGRTLPLLLDPVLALEHEATAVETTAGSLDYRAYVRHAYQLAHLLRRRGVGRNQMVPVVMARTATMPATLYGIVCAGGAYVPLEPDMPAERMRGIVADVAARVVVTDAETLYAEALALGGTQVESIVCIDAWPRGQYAGLPVLDARALAGQEDSAPTPWNAPDDLCYVIFTSGSTGKPKGVMISHLNIVNTLIGVNNVFNVGSEDRILCFSSYGFDLSVWDIFGAALAGASVFVPTKQEIRDPAALLRIVTERAITIWDSVPTGMSQLLLPLAGRTLPPMPQLRLAMLSGEFIPLNLPQDIRARFPHCRVVSLGGATEGTVWSIYHPVEGPPDAAWTSIPYGRPLPNQRMYVLDEAQRPCPVGQKGMIYIGGLGVAQGYYGDAERSERAFGPAPWSDEPGGRIYRTGDLGIMHANGLIEIAGRADQQVKIRGYRVELGEVESHLNALEVIDQAAIIVRREEDGGNRLIAFYTSRQGEQASATLQAQLLERLPAYMVPAQFVFLKQPPVGSSGKLDRAALEARQVGRDDMGGSYAAPGNETERQLAEALARILRLERVGVDDDFLLIGGDSLLALQYLSELARLGFEATPRDIQLGRSIRGVLARVRRAGDRCDDELAAASPPGPMGQKFLERLPLTERHHWNQSIVIGFDHQPDAARLAAALRRIVVHHAMLGARLADGQLHPQAEPRFGFDVLELERMPFWRRRAAWQGAVASLQASLRPEQGEMCKALLVQLAPRDWRLVWVAHHLVVDAHCWRVLIEDLATLYRTPAENLLRATPFARFAAALAPRAEAACAELAGQRPPASMPVPGLAPASGWAHANTEADAGVIDLALPEALTRRLLGEGAGQRAPAGQPPVHLSLLAAVSLALSRWSGDAAARFDVVSNGRDVLPEIDVSRTVGWFATHNPLAVHPGATAATALAAVAQAWPAYQRDARDFVAACNLAAQRPGHAFGGYADQVLLYNYLGVFDGMSLPQGWQVQGHAGHDRGPNNPRTHWLELDALVAGGRLRLSLRYAGKLHGRRHGRRLLAHLRSCLLAVAAENEAAPVQDPTPSPNPVTASPTTEGTPA